MSISNKTILENVTALDEVQKGLLNKESVSASVGEYFNKFVASQSFGIGSTLSAKLSIDRLGTIRVFTPATVMIKDYSHNNDNKADKLEFLEHIVRIEYEKVFYHELPDTFDFKRGESSDEYKMSTLGTQAISTAAYMDSVFFQLAVKAVSTNVTENPELIANGNILEMPTFDAVVSKTQADDDSYNFNRGLTAKQMVFDRIKFGFDKGSLLTIMNPVSEINRKYGLTAASASDKAFDLLVNGGIQIKDFWGNQYTTSNLVGNSIPRGTAFIKDENIDFTNIQALSVYNGAIAVIPALTEAIVGRTQDGTHPTLMTKIAYGAVCLRPDLIFAVVKKMPATAVNKLTGVNFSFVNGNTISRTPNSTLTIDAVKVPVYSNVNLPTDLEAILTDNDGVEIPQTEMTASVSNGVITITSVAPLSTRFNAIVKLSSDTNPELSNFDEIKIK